jgi:hypothetical protein
MEVTLDVVNVNIWFLDISQAVEEVFPDPQSVRFIERLVMKCELNAWLEGLVEDSHTVGGQDKDAVVVLKRAKKDGHQGISL